jgi:integrase
MDLSIVRDREKLKPNKKAEPCWQRIRPGCYVGFVPSAKGGQGTWVARAYDEETRRYRRKALGAFPELPGDKKFTSAKAEAERFADKIASGGHAEEKIDTVADACRAFAKGRPDDEARFRRYVDNDPIAKVKLDKLRRRHLKAWRERLEAVPALVSRNKAGDKRTRDRSPATINRDMAALRAALGSRLAQGDPGTEAAWQEALRPIKNAGRRRDLYLDRSERKKLLQHVDAQAEPFVRALCQLPLRPGAIAALSVRDFDKRTSELTIGKDKSGKDRRIQIPAGAAQLLENQSKNKLPGAPIFMRAGGERWNKDSWKHPISAAVAAAGLSAEATAYTLRHSTITDLVRHGLPLLTIAQISGTSAEMIEKHYGHLARDAAVKALQALAL